MTKTKNKLPLLWTVFAAYSVLTLLGALNHEVWLDEAQAWVILRDAPLSELPNILKVEGHPPLWYVILYPFVKLGFPAEYASVISWFFTAAGVWVLLFKVGLPLPLKAVMLASSGFLYFNSVMLRVYCLIPLLLFLILWVYPKRREHAVVYGLLIALLANTHVFISGIVGMLGIFMLYDLFSEWKSASKKENAGKLIGLAVAGIGVLVLVVPLIGSIGANGGMETPNSLQSLLYKLSHSIMDIFECYFNLSPRYSFFWCILLLAVTLAFWIMVILLRHWRRTFAIELCFITIYIIIDEVIWISMPSRAAIFVLSFAFALGLTEYEKPVFKDYRLSDKINGWVRKLLELCIRLDQKAKNAFLVLITVCFAVSVPVGAKILWQDICGDFTASKKTAEYISENLKDDTVLVCLGFGFPEISFYDPDIKIYSIVSDRYVTFSRWNYRYHGEEPDDKIRLLPDSDEYILIYYYSDLEYTNTFFKYDDTVEYDVPKNSFAICRCDKVFFRSYITNLKIIYDEEAENT